MTPKGRFFEPARGTKPVPSDRCSIAYRLFGGWRRSRPTLIGGTLGPDPMSSGRPAASLRHAPVAPAAQRRAGLDQVLNGTCDHSQTSGAPAARVGQAHTGDAGRPCNLAHPHGEAPKTRIRASRGRTLLRLRPGSSSAAADDVVICVSGGNLDPTCPLGDAIDSLWAMNATPEVRAPHERKTRTAIETNTWRTVQAANQPSQEIRATPGMGIGEEKE